MKIKTKLESTLDELESSHEKEKRSRANVEKDRRKIEGELKICQETVAELEQFNPNNTNPETGPRFTVKAALYDFWNLEC